MTQTALQRRCQTHRVACPTYDDCSEFIARYERMVPVEQRSVTLMPRRCLSCGQWVPVPTVPAPAPNKEGSDASA